MHETPAGREQPGPQARVLIVEADATAREALSDAVTALGHTVCHAAEPGPAAIDPPAGRPPDLALVRLGAGGEAAEPVLETAEQIVARFGVPIVYVTETADGALLERTERTVPHGYVLEPVDGRQLGLTIRVALDMAAREGAGRERNNWKVAGLRSGTDAAERRIAMFDSLFERANAGVVLADRDGNIEAINPAAKEIYSIYDAPSDWSRFEHFSVYHPDGQTPFAMEDLPLYRAIAGEATNDVLMLLRSQCTEAEAVETWIRANGYPMLDTEGESMGAAVVLWDVTAVLEQEAKAKEVEGELHERVQVLDMIIRSMGDGVVVVDAEGEFTLFNPSAERILGIGITDRPPEEWSELYGVFYADTTTPVPMEELPLIGASRGEVVEDVEFFLRNPNIPEGVYISVNASPLRDEADDIVGGVAVFRDVSERRMEAEALTQAFAHGRLEVIDTVLHNIGNAINSVATGVGTLHEWFDDNELLRRFGVLGDVVTAHDRDWMSWLEHDPQGRQLRPFLVSLIDDLTNEHERLLKTSSRVRERVRHIVDIIRTQASFTSSTVERQAIDLRQTIGDTVRVVQESLGRRNIEIEVDCSRAPAEILVQESRFQQMLVNLIKNAIEATDERMRQMGNGPDWRPEIRLVAYRSKHKHALVIDVIDNGIGIEPSLLKTIFNAGYTTKREGTGLGLHSAANFVIGSGGRIRARSDGIGRGTTMRVMLRIAERRPGSSPDGAVA